MQQEHVLSELQEYAHQTPPPQDAESVKEAAAFLTACNQLFERGILGKHNFVGSHPTPNPILANMEKGFVYFTSWLDEQIGQGNHAVCC